MNKILWRDRFLFCAEVIYKAQAGYISYSRKKNLDINNSSQLIKIFKCM